MALPFGNLRVRALDARGRLRGRFRLLTVALVKAVNSARRVHKLLLAREERVALRADFDVYVALLRRARLERVAAGAVNRDVVVVRMNSLLHFVSSSVRRAAGALKESHMIRARVAHRQAVQALGCAGVPLRLPGERPVARGAIELFDRRANRVLQNATDTPS